MSSQDPNAVGPGSSTYSLRSPDTVSAAVIPSMPMERVLPRQTSTGLARGIQQLGSPNVYVDSGNEQIVVAKTDGTNSSTPQVLMGNQVNKGEGFYVTKSGVDVTTASSDADFIFNSNQNVFKIVKEIDLTLSFTRTSSTFASYTTSKPHGLTFTPSYQYNLGLDPNITTIPPSSNFSGLFVFTANVAGVYTPFGQAYCTVDSTYVYFQIDMSSLASGTYSNTAVVFLEQQTFSPTV